MREKILTLLLIAIVTGCASGIPKESLKQADREITFQSVVRDPDRYSGKVIVAGGQIISTIVQQGVTWVEVLQHPLDWRERPKETDISYGRFLVRFEGFADPAIYSPGKKITIIGEVAGHKTQPVDHMQYPFPVLIPREQYLWTSQTAAGPLFHFGFGVGGVFR